MVNDQIPVTTPIFIVFNKMDVFLKTIQLDSFKAKMTKYSGEDDDGNAIVKFVTREIQAMNGHNRKLVFVETVATESNDVKKLFQTIVNELRGE